MRATLTKKWDEESWSLIRLRNSEPVTVHPHSHVKEEESHGLFETATCDLLEQLSAELERIVDKTIRVN